MWRTPACFQIIVTVELAFGKAKREDTREHQAETNVALKSPSELLMILLNNSDLRRMASSGMLRHVVLVRTEVSEELSASFIRVTRIGELETTLSVTSNRHTLLHLALFLVNRFLSP
jgi:hypothetical protein